MCGTNFISSRSELGIPARGLVSSVSDGAAKDFGSSTPRFSLQLSETEAILLLCLLYVLVGRNEYKNDLVTEDFGSAWCTGCIAARVFWSFRVQVGLCLGLNQQQRPFNQP